MHEIQVIIGRASAMERLAGAWSRAKVVALPQDTALIFATRALICDMVDQSGLTGSSVFPQFERLVPALDHALKAHSQGGALAFVETEYFGGTGTQAAILYLDGHVKLGPLRQETTVSGTTGDDAINTVLRELGVRREAGDEFEAIALGDHRKMPR